MIPNKRHLSIGNILLFPIHYISNKIADVIKLHPKNKKFVHCIIGALLAFGGVLLSKIHVDSVMSHYLVDYLGYFLHGLGLAPTAKLIAELLQIEI